MHLLMLPVVFAGLYSKIKTNKMRQYITQTPKAIKSHKQLDYITVEVLNQINDYQSGGITPHVYPNRRHITETEVFTR